jgi:hypothetical protein
MKTEGLVHDWLLAQHLDVESEQYDKVSWAVDHLFDLSHSDPARLLDLIQIILEVDSAEKTTGSLGAGPIEDLLVHYGDSCIDKVVELADKNQNFKTCLKFTFLDENDVSTEVYEKFKAITRT